MNCSMNSSNSFCFLVGRIFWSSIFASSVVPSAAGLIFHSFKDIQLIPDIVPNRKEPGGNKLAYSNLDSVLPKYVEYEVIEQKGVKSCVDDVTPGSYSQLGWLFGLKDPESLQYEIERD